MSMTTTSPTTLSSIAPASSANVGHNKKLGPLVVLWKFFGPHTEDQTREQFVQELKGLSRAEKLELAILAADAMGIPAEDRTFASLEQAAA